MPPLGRCGCSDWSDSIEIGAWGPDRDRVGRIANRNSHDYGRKTHPLLLPSLLFFLFHCKYRHLLLPLHVRGQGFVLLSWGGRGAAHGVAMRLSARNGILILHE